MQEFKYKVISILDAPFANLQKFWPGCINFIKEARAQGGNVFVHCFAGVSRSSSTVIAYLIQEHGMSFHEGMAYVRKRRPIIFPNIGF